MGSAEAPAVESAAREMEDRQQQQREMEMEEAFASVRIPGTFRRRPLGPVRRSDELENRSLLSSSSG